MCIYLAARSSTVVVVVVSRDWSTDSSEGKWEGYKSFAKSVTGQLGKDEVMRRVVELRSVGPFG